MFPKKNDEYYGRLFYKSSGTLCLDNAVIWFVKDSRGGWSELQIKLGNNDLEMRAARVPADKSDFPDLVADLVQSCVAQGARDLVPPEKPLTYTAQVDVLKTKGLLGKVTVSGTGPATVATPEEEALLASHQKEIKKLLAQGLYEEVSDDNTGDENPNKRTEEVIESDASLHDSSGPPPPGQAAPSTVVALAAELNLYKDSYKKLENKLGASTAKVLQLENEAATGRGSLVEELSSSIKETMKEEFRKIKLELLSQVNSEINTSFNRNLTRNNDEVLNGFGGLATAADLNENMDILKDRTSDLIQSSARLGKDISSISAMSSKVGECSKTLAIVSSQLSSQKNMIVDALKDKVPPEIVELTTPLKTSSKYPLTPLSGPRDYQQTSSSRSAGHATSYQPQATRFDSPGRDRERGVEHRRHSRSRSPSRVDFCPRCLDPKHKMHKCPHIAQRCTICIDNGVEESFAYGHLRKIHSETDRRRRQHILRYLPSVCFPSW